MFCSDTIAQILYSHNNHACTCTYKLYKLLIATTSICWECMQRSFFILYGPYTIQLARLSTAPFTISLPMALARKHWSLCNSQQLLLCIYIDTCTNLKIKNSRHFTWNKPTKRVHVYLQRRWKGKTQSDRKDAPVSFTGQDQTAQQVSTYLSPTWVTMSAHALLHRCIQCWHLDAPLFTSVTHFLIYSPPSMTSGSQQCTDNHTHTRNNQTDYSRLKSTSEANCCMFCGWV